MGAKSDLIFVIVVIVALGFVWVFTGGIERTRNNPGAFLKPPAPLDSGEAYGQINLSPSSVKINRGSISGEDVEDSENKVLETRPESLVSEFENKISIKNSSTGPKKSSVSEEYITLNASRKNKDKISITGWKLISAISGKQITVGRGVEVYRSGIINTEQNITIKPGETVIITTGRSPIGVSFKTNKCVGYFEQFQDFSPSLSKRCPYPNDEYDNFAIIPANDLTCGEIIDDIRRCEMSLNALPLGTTNECSNFISQNINYTGCVKNHKNDLDFIEKEWRVFLGRSEELWRESKEEIKLIDNTGKTVDTYIY